MRAALDRGGHLTGNTCYIIPGDHAYLLAILNSTLIDFYSRLALPCLVDPFDGGDLRFFNVDMERTPIASAEAETKQCLATLADRIQTAREADAAADTSALERRGDEIVYTLYQLDERAVTAIEQALA